jgi:hypothetical protein
MTSRKTARRLDPILVDAHSKSPIALADAALIAGPRATSRTRERLALIQAKRLETTTAKG